MPRTPENLRRRAITLEHVVSLFERISRETAIQALNALSCGDLELLITAFRADAEGRPLTEDEEFARQYYLEVLESKSVWVRATNWLEPKPDLALIYQAMIVCVGLRLPYHIIFLSGAVLKSNYEPTDREVAAHEAVSAEWDRLARLAGFEDADDLDYAFAH